MPRYFFDIHDGERSHEDEDGADFAVPDEAREELVGSLATIASDRLPDGDNRDFAGTLRDGVKRPLFQATLSLRSGWVNGGTDRDAFEEAIRDCRAIRLRLGDRGSFPTRTLFDMLLLELDRDLKRQQQEGAGDRPEPA